MSKNLSEETKIALAKIYAHDNNLTRNNIRDTVDNMCNLDFTAASLIDSHTSVEALKNLTAETQNKLLDIVNSSSDFSSEEKEAFAQTVQNPSVASGSKVKI